MSDAQNSLHSATSEIIHRLKRGYNTTNVYDIYNVSWDLEGTDGGSYLIDISHGEWGNSNISKPQTIGEFVIDLDMFLESNSDNKDTTTPIVHVGYLDIYLKEVEKDSDKNEELKNYEIDYIEPLYDEAITIMDDSDPLNIPMGLYGSASVRTARGSFTIDRSILKMKNDNPLRRRIYAVYFEGDDRRKDISVEGIRIRLLRVG